MISIIPKDLASLDLLFLYTNKSLKVIKICNRLNILKRQFVLQLKLKFDWLIINYIFES